MKGAEGAKDAARTHYETMGVDPTASLEEIKAAYFKLAHERHPDKGGSTAAFQRLSEAYEALSNPVKRKAYDAPRLAAVSKVGRGKSRAGPEVSPSLTMHTLPLSLFPSSPWTGMGTPFFLRQE